MNVHKYYLINLQGMTNFVVSLIVSLSIESWYLNSTEHMQLKLLVCLHTVWPIHYFSLFFHFDYEKYHVVAKYKEAPSLY
jgi:hypothetical protein